MSEWHFPNQATAPGSSGYYSIRFAPVHLHDALAALFGWRHEVRRIISDVSDPGVARLKLDWWRDEIRRSIDGAPRHPLSHALMPGLEHYALPIEPFLEQAQQVENTLYARQNRDRQHQHQALVQDRGALFELICRCHAMDEPNHLATARNAGAWCEQVRRIRDAGLLLRQGREVLPHDVLQDAGLSHEQLCSPEHRQRLPELLVPLVEGMLLRERPSHADRVMPARALRIQTRIHSALLDELIRCKFDVVNQRIGLTPLRKLWIAWRTAV
ncbi:MAG: squalene/phytoene synthase family protein [Thiohalocapsa sp. PB-PSB1]|nr:MAG: squalene/phytoene synthase family protein [Thiohalocapsa sp. PB-PSB1]